MDEIRFLNIIAPPSQNVKQPGIADSNSTNLPPILTRLPPGSILAGFVINRDANGNPILRTESGDITFQSKLFFRIGAELVIRVDTRQGQQQATIISIDGNPPPAPEKGAVLPKPIEGQSQPPRQPQDTIAPISQPRLTPAATISAQATITATLLTEQPDLPSGSQLLVRVLSAAEPATTAPKTAPSAPAQSAAPTSPYAAYAKAVSTTNPPPNPATTQTPVGTPQQAQAPLPAASTAQTPPPITLGSVLQGVVTGRTPTGETIIQTSTGATLQLNTTSPLPQGISLTFDVNKVSQSGQPQTQPVSASELPDPVTTLARQWPALQQIVTLLTQHLSADSLNNSGLASLFGHAPPQGNAAPTLNPQAIPSGLMVFIAALRGGDFRGWLGRENSSWLEDNGHGTLVRKAEGEFLALGKQFGEAQPGQWQSLFFPIAVHGDVQQVRFFLKRDRKQKNDREGTPEEDTRFIVELDLSQMGELQLDGFVRKDPELLEFDLYVRTRTQLDDATKQDIFAIYNQMAELTGYKGQLAFQTVQEFPVRPLEETNIPHSDLNA